MTLPKRPLALAAVTTFALGASIVGVVSSAHATAPGKNGRIAFRRYLDVARTTSAIFTANSDGTSVHQITHPSPGIDDREPDWSPDGRQLAFERKVPCPAGGPADGLNNTCDTVYTVRRNGQGFASLVPCEFHASEPFPGSCVGVDDPAWSPDGSMLAFQYNLVDRRYAGSFNLNAGIWIVNADGTDAHQVTNRTPGTAWDFGPQWSPDGTELVFYRADLVLGADAVFTVGVDGSDQVQVTPWELGAGDHPDWSPDGNWLLFRVQPGDGSSNVYTSHPDGSALTNLTGEPAGGRQYLSSGFSPDGSMIVSARTPGTGPEGAADVVVMNADGSKIHPVTETRLWDSGADWGSRPMR
jgi:Tol biopolymer transport system component